MSKLESANKKNESEKNITARKKRIVFQIGGPEFHPAAQQAGCIVDHLGPGFVYELRHGVDTFEDLDNCNLLVLMGFHGPESRKDEVDYRPMRIKHQQVFEEYVTSGRPLLILHGGIGSYSDWPSYGELRGFTWVFGETGHWPEEYVNVKILSTNHPVIAGVEDYTVYDEIYYKIKITEGLPMIVHAQTTSRGLILPMVMTAEGGRVKGAGRVVYLANGHSLPATKHPSVKKLYVNAVNWLMEEKR